MVQLVENDMSFLLDGQNKQVTVTLPTLVLNSRKLPAKEKNCKYRILDELCIGTHVLFSLTRESYVNYSIDMPGIIHSSIQPLQSLSVIAQHKCFPVTFQIEVWFFSSCVNVVWILLSISWHNEGYMLKVIRIQ